jgi:hypothetical protein
VQANKNSLLDHLRWIRDAVYGRRGDFLLVGNSLRLAVRRLGMQWLMEPRFLDDRGRVIEGVPEVREFLTGFAGWLPYSQREWDLAADRRRFHSFLREHSLPFPELKADGVDAGEHVLVRRAEASDDDAVLGPFRTSADHPLAEGQYYEPFLPGTRVRLWYWNGAALCGEIQQMPTVVGDGATSLRDLVFARATLSHPLSEEQQGALLARLSPLLSLQGHVLASALPRGVAIAIDHRMDSPLALPSDRQTFLVEGGDAPEWLDTARRAGEVLRTAAPEKYRDDLLFAIEGVIGSQDQFWILDLDVNPVVQPVLYPAIIATMFERTGAPDTETEGNP